MALLKWLQYVEGVDVLEAYRRIELGTGKRCCPEQLLYYLAKEGLEIWRVKAKVLCRKNRLALKLGVRRIHMGNVTLEAEKGRIVGLRGRKSTRHVRFRHGRDEIIAMRHREMMGAE